MLAGALERPGAIGYNHIMRVLVRRSLILLLSLSFAASGMAARQCDAAHHSVAPVDAAQHAIADHHHHAHSEHEDTHADRIDAAALHQHAPIGKSPAADDHASDKCSGLCAVAVAMTLDAPATVIFTVSPAAFAERRADRSAATIKVDPGIPKPIV